MSNPPTDNGIPMLTEIIAPDTPAAKPVAPAAPTPPAAPAISPNPFSVLPKPAEARTLPPTPATQPLPEASPASAPLPPSSILKPQAAPQPVSAAPAAIPKPAMPVSPPVAATPAKPPVSPAPVTVEPDWPEITTLTAIPSDEWQRLENDIRQRISRQVLERIDFVLDHRLRSSIATVVDQAMDGLATEIKRGLHETLEETVSRAVTQEIARLNPSKK